MRNWLGILFVVVATIGLTGNTQAQMVAARRVPPAIEKKVKLNAPAQEVWDYISEPGNYKKFSGVKEFTCTEKALNAKIELTTKSGKKRSQYISVIDYDNYKLCYFTIKSDYAGDRNWVYSFEVHPKGDEKCEFIVSVYNGFDELEPVFKEGITAEFNDIITGVTKKFK